MDLVNAGVTRVVMPSEKTKCDACEGTGWTGDNGPGIEGNSEFYRCDCGGDGKCRIGWHPYRLISGVAWCDKCNREADMDVCKLQHPLPCPPVKDTEVPVPHTPTPETDAFRTMYRTLAEARVFERRLERERDEARVEVSRLLALCTNVHDRLLRGDDDTVLLAMLAESWKARKAGKGEG